VIITLSGFNSANTLGARIFRSSRTSMLKQGNIIYSFNLGVPDQSKQISDRTQVYIPAAQTAKCGHSRIIPAWNFPCPDSSGASFYSSWYMKGEPVEFNLPGLYHLSWAVQPASRKWPVHFKLGVQREWVKPFKIITTGHVRNHNSVHLPGFSCTMMRCFTWSCRWWDRASAYSGKSIFIYPENTASSSNSTAFIFSKRLRLSGMPRLRKGLSILAGGESLSCADMTSAGCHLHKRTTFNEIDGRNRTIYQK